MTVIQVQGAGFTPYGVVVGAGLLAQAGDRLKALGMNRVVVVSDTTVAALHGPALMVSLDAAGLSPALVSITPGEASKCFAELERVLDRLLDLGLDRAGAVVALGGGVVGDLAGLAAAVFMRGVDVVQIPTTLLAQVDSSVGGKTAIDTPRGKNLVGAFHHPRLVLADIDTLSTLPARQLRSGWAEVVKHALIADPAYFDWLGGPGSAALRGDTAALARAVAWSVRIKARVVGDDPREAGRRALLNLGHTFGHALEVETGFDDTLTHGEAVALGCALAFRFSERLGLCTAEDRRRAEALIAAAGLPVRLAALPPVSADALLARMAGDKKAEGGRLTLILAEGVGRAVVRKDVDADAVRNFLIEQGARP